MSNAIKPVILCILDGWGQRVDDVDNAVKLAKTPNWDRLNAQYPTAFLQASEEFVGLPKGQMGNSEVGHMNLGAGRVVMQSLPKIDAAINNGILSNNKNIKKFINDLKKSNGTAHIMGLMSAGGVHSHHRHLSALANILHDAGIKVKIHAILDGRDSPPKSAILYMDEFIKTAPNAVISTMVGRYWAMDRDNNWQRVEKAYNLICNGDDDKNNCINPLQAINQSYEDDIFDEFFEPTTIGQYNGMQDGDGLIMANFRADRARQIITSFIDPEFDDFQRKKTINFTTKIGMVEYSKSINKHMSLIFPPEKLKNTLGEIISNTGKKQLRIAETEKYAHVTFFFNGGEEEIFTGEDRILIASPKVATYDLQPEMSAPELTKKLVKAIGSDKYDLIIVNFANADMVGHTGVLNAAIKAIEAVDNCIGKVTDAVKDAGAAMLITADHGNAELMKDPNSGQPHTAHTLNPVPLTLLGKGQFNLNSGSLADIAPTILDLMQIPKPNEMSGQSLINNIKSKFKGK